MKLTIEQVSKLTKLSVPTLRVYVSRQKLGTKVGNRRVFSQAEVQELLKSTKKSGTKGKGSAKSPAAKPTKKKSKARVSKLPSRKAKPRAAKPSAAKTAISASAPTPAPKPEKRSFWGSIFGARKPKEKVKLLEARTK